MVTCVLIDPMNPVLRVTHPAETIIDGDVLAPGMVDRVLFPPPLPLIGFVATDALRLDLPRNPLGGCLLVMLGAPIGVYAGPVLVCGFDPQTTVPVSTAGRIRSLSDAQATMLTRLVEDITAADAGRATGRGGQWDDRCRQVCALISRAGVADPGRRAPVFFDLT